jgi:hypothetical protein
LNLWEEFPIKLKCFQKRDELQLCVILFLFLIKTCSAEANIMIVVLGLNRSIGI